MRCRGSLPAWEGSLHDDGHYANEAAAWARRLSEGDGTDWCAAAEDDCEDKCTNYVYLICLNCSGDRCGQANPPTCTCILHWGSLGAAMGFVPMCIVGVCILGLFMMKMGIIRDRQLDPIPKILPSDHLFDGLFDCSEDVNVCILGCCCPAILIARTYHMAKLGNYHWVLIGISFFYLPVLSPLLLFILFWYRMRLRSAAHISPDHCGDCMASCCCPSCAICQEARHMEEAWRRAHLVSDDDIVSKFVGEPVGVKLT